MIEFLEGETVKKGPARDLLEGGSGDSGLKANLKTNSISLPVGKPATVSHAVSSQISVYPMTAAAEPQTHSLDKVLKIGFEHSINNYTVI